MNFSVTEENARHGDAGTPEVPPAGGPGARSTPAPPGSGSGSGAIPPRPSSPPTSATPVVPPAAAVGNAAPAGGPQAEPPLTDTAGPTGSAAAERPAVPANPETSDRTKPGSSADTRFSFTYFRSRTSAASQASGAAKLVTSTAARLGRWVRRQGLARMGAAAVVVVVVGLLVWLLASILGGPKPSEAASPVAGPASSAPASRGPLPLENVSPLDFRLGDCFKDFDPDAPQSTVVACDTGHSAQLVAIEQYAAPDAYPGRDDLKQRARDACKAATLGEKSGSYDLSYKLAYPSSSSWEKGDRRVDCYVVANTGNVIQESLLP